MAITLNQVKKLKHGDIIHLEGHKKTNGECKQWRVNGKMKTWKTRPSHFKIPVKNGIYQYGYITHENMDVFHLPKKSCK